VKRICNPEEEGRDRHFERGLEGLLKKGKWVSYRIPTDCD
jgi:hypothetical protein